MKHDEPVLLVNDLIIIFPSFSDENIGHIQWVSLFRHSVNIEAISFTAGMKILIMLLRLSEIRSCTTWIPNLAVGSLGEWRL